MKSKTIFSNFFNFLEKVEEHMDNLSDVSIAVKWRDEHDLILGLCQNVIKAFMSHNRMGIKSNLKKLNTALTDHFLEEDMELYAVCKQDLLPNDIIEKMAKYTNDHRESRVRILSTLSVYALPDKVLDEVFFEGFNLIYAELMDLFRLEESSLYIHMEEQCICKKSMILNDGVVN